MRRVAASMGLVLVASCGGGQADMGATCSLSFVVVGSPPVEAPATVVLDATVDTSLVGFRELSWEVSFEGAPVAYLVRNENDATTIEFEAPQPGPYEVALSGRVGTVECAVGDAAVNVLAPAAAAAEYVLQVLPVTGTGYARLVTVYGGADSSLGPLDVQQATTSTRLIDSSGAGLEAFVRFVPAGFEASATELASTSAGEIEVGLAPGRYDLLVAPYGDSAPFQVAGLSETLPTWISAPSPKVVAVNVASGAPLSGAVVRLAVDGGPAALTTTNGAGAGQAKVAPGSAIEIEVIPPQGSSLPRLATTTSAVPSSISVAYQAPSTRTLSFTVVDEGSDPLPGARVRLAGTVSGAGTIDVGAGPKVTTGRFVRTLIADGSGVVGPVTVPQVLYDVVVSPDGGMPTLATLDLQVGQPSPAQLVYAAPVAIAGTVATADGGAVDGALVRARAVGALSGLGADGAAVLSNAAGVFSLTLASGEDYEVVVEGDPDGAYARSQTLVTSGLGVQADVEVAEAVTLQGRLQRGTEALVSARVVLIEPTTGAVIASTITGDDGSFAVPVPDPGTQ